MRTGTPDGTRNAWIKEKAADAAISLPPASWQHFDLWLDCRTEREIAEEIGITQPTVGEWLKEKRQMADFFQPPASWQHFDVWNFAKADNESSYFGQDECRNGSPWNSARKKMGKWSAVVLEKRKDAETERKSADAGNR
jgi:hypothetical protein